MSRYTPKYKGLKYHLEKNGDELGLAFLLVILAALAGLLWLVVLFFQKVNNYHLWKEFIASFSIFAVTNILIYSISLNTSIEVFIWGLLITFLIFCIYWGVQLGSRS